MTLTLSRNEALRNLQDIYRMPHATAVRALAIADQIGVNAESGGSHTITIRALNNGKAQYEISNGIPSEAVGRVPKTSYTSGNKGRQNPTRKEGRTMPRGRAAAPAAPAAPAVENGARDLSAYADKEPTAKMVDYHEWLENELGQKLDQHSVYVGVTLYPHFQRSDFNKTRTAERRAARNAEAEPEPAPEPKAARGRKAAAAKSGGTTGKRAAATPTTGRGRGRKAAAPF